MRSPIPVPLTPALHQVQCVMTLRRRRAYPLLPALRHQPGWRPKTIRHSPSAAKLLNFPTCLPRTFVPPNLPALSLSSSPSGSLTSTPALLEEELYSGYQESCFSNQGPKDGKGCDCSRARMHRTDFSGLSKPGLADSTLGNSGSSWAPGRAGQNIHIQFFNAGPRPGVTLHRQSSKI